MNYRDMLGFSKKQPKKKVEKRVAPTPTAPPITKLLKKEFGQLNEWTSKPPTEKRWSGAFTAKDGLTEFERKGGKDNVNEGPAGEYAKEWSNFEKAFGNFFTATLKLGKMATKMKGDKVDEKIFTKNFNKDVGKFYSLMQSWYRGEI